MFMIELNSDGSENRDTTNGDWWYARKLQPWPAAAWSEKFRFEKGDKAIGYVHNKLGTNNADRWKDEMKTLNFSLTSASLSLATVGAFIGLFAF